MTDLSDLDLDKAAAAASLSPAARAVHRWVLTVFAETGRAPSRTDLQRAARERTAETGVAHDAVVAELTGRDVLALDERGEIRAAYPFSPEPTRHRVSWHGGPAAYAMCAIDALGMSAMLGIPVTITSAEPGTERAVTVHVDHDTARWEPDTAVVFAGHTDDDTACCPSVDRTCGHINFFTTVDAAHAWAANNPSITGAIRNQHQALASGIAEFGALMAGTTDTPTPDDR
ncbi:alkylmercury lyase-like protein [Amycolatopsis echigonensis]|uniref:Alkylmercury lyase-like protein n=2 Tax=Pseudonocardiaceae TaxID=2070 RepID=A0A2N3WJL9_9PSEU|nr:MULTISPECIES: alkylmercury lyase family protein [Pseudonocardiaceae]AEA23556.1 alkylmercury lyase [Pseudonocardia dioxanivorans CB1190]PKV94070.1 alkylmercury lyase-like protein [Amycolatopsis niigatensis]